MNKILYNIIKFLIKIFIPIPVDLFRRKSCLLSCLLQCLLLVIIISSSCYACEGACPRCVDADDFDNLKVSASASFKRNSPQFIADNNESSDGKHPNQVVRWIKTGFYTNGQNLIIKAKGQWTGLGGLNLNQSTICNLNSPIPQDTFCTYTDAEYTDPITRCQIKGKKLDDQSKDGYCWHKNGYGLYVLFRKPDQIDPNSSLDIMRNPVSPVIHIGYNDEGHFSLDSHTLQDPDCRDIQIEKDWEIYVKIYDVFYWDNTGGYQLEFASGVTNMYGGGFFESIRSAVHNVLLRNTRGIYEAITQNNNFINFVKALLVLYIIITGLGFLIGISQNTATELLIKVMKIAIIIQLISPSSWDFFYNNLFALFIEGLNEILVIVNSHSVSNYDPSHPFSALDAMVIKIFNIYGGPKVKALLVSSPWGFFWCFFMLIVLIVYVILLGYAFLIYLTALVGISLLIILMPILFLGLLFGPLKQTFDNWFTQAISFCLQSIMIFTLVSLFGAMIMNNFYRNLGFTACCHVVLVIDLSPFSRTEIYQWAPGQRFRPFEINFIPWDWDIFDSARHSFDNKRSVIKVPPDYEKEECRYLDYPFFDPKIEDADCGNENINGTGDEWNIIQGIQTKEDGLIFWKDMFTILLLCVLLYHMRTFVQSLGAAIAGASPFQTVLGMAYRQANTIGHFFQMVTGSIQQIWNQSNFGPKGLERIEEKIGTIARKIPGVEFAGKFIQGAKFMAGAESDLEREYFEKKQFKEIQYKQAMMGYHLEHFKFGGDLYDSFGIKIMRNLSGHAYDKYIAKDSKYNTAEKPYSLIDGAFSLYKSERHKIHDFILGQKQDGPQKVTTNTNQDGSNLFKTEDQKADTTHSFSIFNEFTGDQSKQRNVPFVNQKKSPTVVKQEKKRNQSASDRFEGLRKKPTDQGDE